MDMLATPAQSPQARYRAALAAGRLKSDSVQALAVEKLESLHRALADYVPPGKSGWREAWAARLGLGREQEAPQGLYLYGAVGRGKSMLMDLFFLASPVERKRRVHFLAFMLEFHTAAHSFRQTEEGAAGGDPVPPFADAVADAATLLCFDEFQVTNIADAMILGRLFKELFERGVVIVATSNLAPDDLYPGGLQRELFLPFVALIKERLDLLALDGGIDYRLAKLKGKPSYYNPLGPKAEAAIAQAFADLGDDAAPEPAEIEVQGRSLLVPRTANGIAWFTFAELCEQPLGAADYLALAGRYRAVLVSGVPRLSPEQHNEARRFMHLIDALYEHKVKLVMSADAPPDAIYPEGPAAADFKRTASRLHEMQSQTYLGLPPQ
jgi:cell division protein ZapE